jgi:hypothetical protein
MGRGDMEWRDMGRVDMGRGDMVRMAKKASISKEPEGGCDLRP